MNKILFWCWSVLAFLNLGLWVLDGCADFDTLQRMDTTPKRTGKKSILALLVIDLKKLAKKNTRKRLRQYGRLNW